MRYDIELGYGVRVKEHAREGDRPAGHVVEIHFYEKEKAVECAVEFIRNANEEAEKQVSAT